MTHGLATVYLGTAYLGTSERWWGEDFYFLTKPKLRSLSLAVLPTWSVSSASSRYSELCDRKRAIALSEILIFAGFRKFFEKYYFLKLFYPGTQYESNSARRVVSAKPSLREQLGYGSGDIIHVDPVRGRSRTRRMY